MKRRAFTLIELLIVIAIVAVLAVTVILTLNPSELLRQARDSNRLSDLASLNSALGAYQASGGNSMGSSSVVYVSIPDTSSTCANLNLPSLPSGWAYNCRTTSTYLNANGTGWIPVNLSHVDQGSPLTKLPVDPSNTTTTGQYYTYSTATSSFEVGVSLESTKYLSASYSDGGNDVLRVERGSNLAITPPLATELWLDASSITGLSDGSSVSQWSDLSGNARHLTNASTTQRPVYRTNILNGLPVVRFDGVNDQLAIPSAKYGAAVAVVRRTGSSQSVLQRGLSNYRGFTINDQTTAYDIFDRYWVNGVTPTSSLAGLNAHAILSAALAANPLTTQAANLGEGTPSFASLSGDVDEFIVWSAPLSTTDRRKVEAYLGKKWGIAVQ